MELDEKEDTLGRRVTVTFVGFLLLLFVNIHKGFLKM